MLPEVCVWGGPPVSLGGSGPGSHCQRPMWTTQWSGLPPSALHLHPISDSCYAPAPGPLHCAKLYWPSCLLSYGNQGQLQVYSSCGQDPTLWPLLTYTPNSSKLVWPLSRAPRLAFCSLCSNYLQDRGPDSSKSVASSLTTSLTSSYHWNDFYLMENHASRSWVSKLRKAREKISLKR